MQTRRSTEAGFTLLELCVTLALIGALAAIALPSFASSARDSKLKTEVNSVFGEIRLREEAYIAQSGGYLSTGSSEQESFPTTPSHSPQALGAMPTTWTRLKVRMPEAAACTYVVISGGPDDPNTVGVVASGSFAYQAPDARAWFYMLARCYDGDRDTYFFASHEDSSTHELDDVDPAAPH